MLLQIMEDGHLSDAKGRRVDFRNAILIMTSNVGRANCSDEHVAGLPLLRGDGGRPRRGLLREPA